MNFTEVRNNFLKIFLSKLRLEGQITMAIKAPDQIHNIKGPLQNKMWSRSFKIITNFKTTTVAY